MKTLMKRISLILVSVIMLLSIAACSEAVNVSTAPNNAAKEAGTAASASSEPVEIQFWHAMGGKGGEAIKKYVADFNASQDKIKVVETYQGSYDDALSKAKTALQADNGPDVMQIYDIGTRFMIDSGWTIPIQQLVDADKFDLSTLEPNILAYYTVDGKLYSMPFNSSTPIMYYNKDAFKNAGLDPGRPPKTFKDLEYVSKKLTTKDSSGQVTMYGMSFAIYGWFFEQFQCKMGKDFANNGNGRSGLATEVSFVNQENINLLNWWKRGVDEGWAANLGRKTADTKAAFLAHKVAIILDSTAALESVMAADFNVGTAYYPNPLDNEGKGVSIGGGSIWIMKKNDAQQKAAWEFVKYLVAPEQQAFWATQTGYFPISKEAQNQQLFKDLIAKYPQFNTALNQLHDSPGTTGAIMGVFPEARQDVEKAIEDCVLGQKSAEQSLNDAASAINSAISDYNATYSK